MIDCFIIVNWSQVPAERLVELCAGQDSSAAWEEFMRRYHSVIAAAALRVTRRWGDGTAQEVDDVVQEIYLKLCANGAQILTGFRSAQPEAIFGYMKVVATNTAHDFFRRRTAGKRGPAQPTELTEIADPGNAPKDLDQRVRFHEIDQILIAKTQAPNGKRDRAIFRLYYRYGMTAEAISELPGVQLSPKGVEGVLHRLTRIIRSEVERPQEFGSSSRPRK